MASLIEGNISMSRSTLLLALFLFIQPIAYAETLVLGVYPYLNISEVLQRFDPLANYLSSALNLPVEISVSHDYAEHIELVGKDFLDIAYLGPVSYVTILEKYKPKVLLGRIEVNGSINYRGAIIIRKNSPIQSLIDLKGKTFAFGDPKSTMSHIVPHYMLLNAGVEDKDLAAYKFLGNHESVALSVLLGQYDAGAVKTSVAKKYVQNNNLKILEWTPYVSEHVFVMKPNLEAKLQSKIQQSFSALAKPENLPILTNIKSSITGFVEAKENNYKNLREMLATLRGAKIID